MKPSKPVDMGGLCFEIRPILVWSQGNLQKKLSVGTLLPQLPLLAPTFFDTELLGSV